MITKEKLFKKEYKEMTPKSTPPNREMIFKDKHFDDLQ